MFLKRKVLSLFCPEKLPHCGSQSYPALPWSFVFKITNSKHQISNKSQIPIFNSAVVATRLLWRSRLTKTFQGGTLFGFSNFGHWKLFVIYNLIFVISISQ